MQSLSLDMQYMQNVLGESEGNLIGMLVDLGLATKRRKTLYRTRFGTRAFFFRVKDARGSTYADLIERIAQAAGFSSTKEGIDWATAELGALAALKHETFTFRTLRSLGYCGSGSDSGLGMLGYSKVSREPDRQISIRELAANLYKQGGRNAKVCSFYGGHLRKLFSYCGYESLGAALRDGELYYEVSRRQEEREAKRIPLIAPRRTSELAR